MDIKALAREAGIEFLNIRAGDVTCVSMYFTSETLESFARLIAEECAKVCEEQAESVVAGYASPAPVKAMMCAQAIRDKFA